MKTIRLSEVNVGDRLSDGCQSIYGRVVNVIVTSKRVTKSGRVMIDGTCDYERSDGTKVSGCCYRHSNGPLSPDAPTELF
jgi:hypothetical protein